MCPYQLPDIGKHLFQHIGKHYLEYFQNPWSYMYTETNSSHNKENNMQYDGFFWPEVSVLQESHRRQRSLGTNWRRSYSEWASSQRNHDHGLWRYTCYQALRNFPLRLFVQVVLVWNKLFQIFILHAILKCSLWCEYISYWNTSELIISTLFVFHYKSLLEF